ncbi:MAG: cytochrome aa3 oxidase assembly protein CtaA [Planctomycetota bacterium]|nr:MAG: cytochrome aa3 oxidase assembly protein CtaA [Planctomycetota bacterium]
MFGIGVVIATLVLIFMGAQVKSHDAGLATHSWPLAWDELWPAEVGAPTLVGGLDITHEHWHRAIGALVGLLALVLAVWTWRHDARALVRRLAWTLLGLIVLQGLLGALTVRMNLPPLVSASHGTLAQSILCFAAWVAWLNTREGAGLAAPVLVESSRVHAARRAAALAFGAVFLQLLLGAWMRHREAGLAVPFFPVDAAGNWLPEYVDERVVLHMLHRGFAFVAVGCVFLGVLRAGAAVPRLMRHGAWLAGAILVQGVLGASIVWTARHPLVTSVHVANGAAVLVLAWLLVLRLGRLSGAVAAPPAEVQAT